MELRAGSQISRELRQMKTEMGERGNGCNRLFGLGCWAWSTRVGVGVAASGGRKGLNDDDDFITRMQPS
jgi:hypothetical protein